LSCKLDDDVNEVAKKIIDKNVNHVAVIDNVGKLLGIVTSFDITKAIATRKRELSSIMTKNVITSNPEEPVDICAKKLEKHDISALPVVDKNNKVIGMITSEKISSLLGRGRN